MFQQVLPVFQAMGKTITHLGPLGSGGFTKLANQIIVAVNLTALAEALTLAAKAGLDIELTLKALGGGLAGSRCLDQKTPNYLAHEFKPGFKIDLHYKDLGLIADAARAPRRAAPGDGRRPGALQRGPREGTRRARSLGDRDGARGPGRRRGPKARMTGGSERAEWATA